MLGGLGGGVVMFSKLQIGNNISLENITPNSPWSAWFGEDDPPHTHTNTPLV